MTVEATEVVETGAEPVEQTQITEPVVDEWADPEPLAEGVDTFDRAYVESLRDREAKYRIKARDLATKVGDLDIDAARAAMEWQQSLQTDEGVVSMFIEAGRALGLGLSELESLFGNEQSTAPESGVTDLSQMNDDDVLTVAQMKALLQEQIIAPQQEQAQAQAIAAATAAVDETLAALGYEKGDDRIETLLRIGEKFLPEDKGMDPEAIRTAVRRAHEELEALVARQAEQYIAGKRETKDKVPSSVGAASPGSQPLPEAQNVEEAKARVRARLRGEG